MVQYTATIQKFAEQGEKTGWTYIEIPADIADELNPGIRKSYRVKGTLDKHTIKGIALLPMGGGSFIMPLNAAMRKVLSKKEGAQLSVNLRLDTLAYVPDKALIEGIETSPEAKKAFYKMPRSHQNYYSKWIESAQTRATREKRIILVVLSLERGLTYGEMLREQAAAKKSL